jgi:hypothetical protein
MDATKRAIIGCALLCAASCARNGEAPESRAGVTEITVARMIMNDDAAMKLANARCEREDACDKVGAFRRFTSQDACVRELFAEAHAAVVPEACPAGVDEGRLSRCLAEIQSQPCEGLRATITEPASCSRDALCTTVTTP